MSASKRIIAGAVLLAPVLLVVINWHVLAYHHATSIWLPVDHASLAHTQSLPLAPVLNPPPHGCTHYVEATVRHKRWSWLPGAITLVDDRPDWLNSLPCGCDLHRLSGGAAVPFRLWLAEHCDCQPFDDPTVDSVWNDSAG